MPRGRIRVSHLNCLLPKRVVHGLRTTAREFARLAGQRHRVAGFETAVRLDAELESLVPLEQLRESPKRWKRAIIDVCGAPPEEDRRFALGHHLGDLEVLDGGDSECRRMSSELGEVAQSLAAAQVVGHGLGRAREGGEGCRI